MSDHQHAWLYKLFEKTSIAYQFGKDNKRYLFFWNFDGKSQLDSALDNYDFETFEYLIH